MTVGQVVSEQMYQELKASGLKFKAVMGGENVKEMLEKVDLDVENKELRRDLLKATTDIAKNKIIKRLKVVESIKKSSNRPEWFMMDVIPIFYLLSLITKL